MAQVWRTLAAGVFVLAVSGCDNDDCMTCSDDREPPPTPTGVYTVTGDESVAIFWNPLIGADVAGYEIYAATDPDGPYDRIRREPGEESYTWVHRNLENGVTLYYAVSAYDFDGNLSALSADYQTVHDTPRPSGAGLRLFSTDLSRAGIDWSGYASGNSGLVVPYDDPLADFVLEAGAGADAGRLFLVGTVIVDGGDEFRNQLQDFGYTNSLDEVDWAPDEEQEDTWAQSAFGVELILGHSYVVWTWDDYYAKFRVRELSPTSVTLDWAYQATDDYDFRFELAPGWKGGVR
jgi:hypothetical protein